MVPRTLLISFAFAITLAFTIIHHASAVPATGDPASVVLNLHQKQKKSESGHTQDKGSTPTDSSPSSSMDGGEATAIMVPASKYIAKPGPGVKLIPLTAVQEASIAMHIVKNGQKFGKLFHNLCHGLPAEAKPLCNTQQSTLQSCQEFIGWCYMISNCASQDQCKAAPNEDSTLIGQHENMRGVNSISLDLLEPMGNTNEIGFCIPRYGVDLTESQNTLNYYAMRDPERTFEKFMYEGLPTNQGYSDIKGWLDVIKPLLEKENIIKTANIPSQPFQMSSQRSEQMDSQRLEHIPSDDEQEQEQEDIYTHRSLEHQHNENSEKPQSEGKEEEDDVESEDRYKMEEEEAAAEEEEAQQRELERQRMRKEDFRPSEVKHQEEIQEEEEEEEKEEKEEEEEEEEEDIRQERTEFERSTEDRQQIPDEKKIPLETLPRIKERHILLASPDGVNPSESNSDRLVGPVFSGDLSPLVDPNSWTSTPHSDTDSSGAVSPNNSNDRKYLRTVHRETVDLSKTPLGSSSDSEPSSGSSSPENDGSSAQLKEVTIGDQIYFKEGPCSGSNGEDNYFKEAPLCPLIPEVGIVTDITRTPHGIFAKVFITETLKKNHEKRRFQNKPVQLTTGNYKIIAKHTAPLPINIEDLQNGKFTDNFQQNVLARYQLADLPEMDEEVNFMNTPPHQASVEEETETETMANAGTTTATGTHTGTSTRTAAGAATGTTFGIGSEGLEQHEELGELFDLTPPGGRRSENDDSLFGDWTQFLDPSQWNASFFT
eukprot:g2956.t1